jgi:hypothetical protein
MSHKNVINFIVILVQVDLMVDFGSFLGEFSEQVDKKKGMFPFFEDLVTVH